MKIGIFGPEHMTITWEQHLRSMSDVHEVVIARKLKLFRNIDACIILGDTIPTEDDSGNLLEVLRLGYHTLWIAPLPTDSTEIKRWHAASEEAGVIVMFSMWAHYSPATRWLFNHINKPNKIHIHREWPGPKNTPDPATLHRIFLEEISLCLEWMHSLPVTVAGENDIIPTRSDQAHSIHSLHMNFPNGSTASILLCPFGLENRHSRFITDDRIAAVCQVNDQLIKKWLLHETKPHTPEIMRFDYKEPARQLLSHFIRSIRTGEQPLYGINELQKLATLIKRLSTS